MCIDPGLFEFSRFVWMTEVDAILILQRMVKVEPNGKMIQKWKFSSERNVKKQRTKEIITKKQVNNYPY